MMIFQKKRLPNAALLSLSFFVNMRQIRVNLVYLFVCMWICFANHFVWEPIQVAHLCMLNRLWILFFFFSIYSFLKKQNTRILSFHLLVLSLYVSVCLCACISHSMSSYLNDNQMVLLCDMCGSALPNLFEWHNTSSNRFLLFLLYQWCEEEKRKKERKHNFRLTFIQIIYLILV